LGAAELYFAFHQLHCYVEQPFVVGVSSADLFQASHFVLNTLVGRTNAERQRRKALADAVKAGEPQLVPSASFAPVLPPRGVSEASALFALAKLARANGETPRQAYCGSLMQWLHAQMRSSWRGRPTSAP
jgi:hypothetical protein